MICIKQIKMRDEHGQVTMTKIDAINKLNEWKESIRLQDSAIKSVTFLNNALEIIYVDQPKEESKYPDQIYSTGRGMVKNNGLIFSVEAFGAEIKKDGNPLELHAPYSRYVLTLLDRTPKVKKEYKKAIIKPKANIPMEEIEDIYINTLVAKIIREQYKIGAYKKGSEATSKSLAYATRLQIGNYKGKTPAQILIENPADAAQLQKTADWLLERINTHQNNKTQYDAIIEAIKLCEEGKLSEESVEIGSQITIYEAEMKSIEKDREDNFRFVYSILIQCDISHEAPYQVTIKNCFAPVIEKEDKTLEVVMEKAIEKEESSIHMTDKEWHTCLRKMYRTADMFEDLTKESIFRRAQNASYFKSNKK